MRQMHLVGFLQAQNCTNLASSWRHPESRTDFLSADYYQEIGRILEAGRFDLGFFDDRLSMPDRYGSDHRHTVEHGIRCVKLDPVVVLTMMAAATSRLGLGSTASTTYYEPFHVARAFQTLDHMSGGRAAWNVVTSLNDGEAANMGHAEAMEHDRRYDRADEFVEVVLGHWDAWEDGALLVDKASGRFGDGSKVHRLDHRGRFLSSRGPFTVPRSPQGHPVLIQAGASGRGKRFSARWAELVFVAHHDLASGRREYAEFKRMVAEAGRDPDGVKIASFFILAIVAVSLVSRLWRTLELRVTEIELDDAAKRFIDEAVRATPVVAADAQTRVSSWARATKPTAVSSMCPAWPSVQLPNDEPGS